MNSKSAWRVLAFGLAAVTSGCVMETEEPTDIASDEEVGTADDAIESGVGVQACVGGAVNVHGSQGAGNLLLTRNSAGVVIGSSPIRCSTLGLAAVSIVWGGNSYEVAASAAFASWSEGEVTCAKCLAFQGSGGPFPPGPGGSAGYRSRIGEPTTLVTLGDYGDTATSLYYVGYSSSEAASHASSYCRDSTPRWGRLTNAYGYELEYGSAWGDNQYLMYDAAKIRATSVKSNRVLVDIPLSDACR
jgi:hypothetical protein